MLLWSPKTLLMPYSQRGVPVWYKNSLTVTLAKPAHIWHKWWHMFISGRAKVIQFSKHILPYKFRRCYIRFLILLFSFIVRQGFSLPLANVASGSKAKEKPEMPQMAGITAKSIYKGGFSWFIYHNSWKCHFQKYLHKKSLQILGNIKIIQDIDHWSVFLALAIYLSFKIIKGKITTW